MCLGQVTATEERLRKARSGIYWHLGGINCGFCCLSLKYSCLRSRRARFCCL